MQVHLIVSPLALGSADAATSACFVLASSGYPKEAQIQPSDSGSPAPSSNHAVPTAFDRPTSAPHSHEHALACRLTFSGMVLLNARWPRFATGGLTHGVLLPIRPSASCANGSEHQKATESAHKMTFNTAMTYTRIALLIAFMLDHGIIR